MKSINMRNAIKISTLITVGIILLIQTLLALYSSKIDTFIDLAVNNEILTLDSLLMLPEKKVQEKFNAELSKSIHDFVLSKKAYQDHLTQLKSNLDQKFALKEIHYQAYKCECDGTCGSGAIGRGSECSRKEQVYLRSNKEYQVQKAEYDSIKAEIESELLIIKGDLQTEISEHVERKREKSISSVTSRINALWYILTRTE